MVCNFLRNNIIYPDLDYCTDSDYFINCAAVHKIEAIAGRTTVPRCPQDGLRHNLYFLSADEHELTKKV